MNDLNQIIKSKFVNVWISQIFSQITVNIMNFLLLIRLFADTNSTIATSFLWVAYALPLIFVGPIASAVVDFSDRRKILIITNLLQSALVFIYAIVNRSQLFLVYGIAVSYSFLNQFYLPAEAASVPYLVKKEKLSFANSLFFLTQQASLILGFTFAGTLNQLLGFDKSLFVCAGFLFVAFISVLFLPPMKIKKEVNLSFEKDFLSFFTEIFEGYRFIKENRDILTPFAFLTFFQISLTVIIVNVPLIAKDILNVPLHLAGLYIVSPAALGAIVSALLVPLLLRKGWRKKRVIENSLLLFVIFDLIIILLTYLPDNNWRILLSLLSIFGIGISFIGTIIPAQTFMQEKTPGGLQGRVFGNFWFLVTIATIFPVIFSGAVSELFGIKTMLIILGVITFLLYFFSRKIGDRFINNSVS